MARTKKKKQTKKKSMPKKAARTKSMSAGRKRRANPHGGPEYGAMGTIM